jgi:hypothetical protein
MPSSSITSLTARALVLRCGSLPGSTGSDPPQPGNVIAMTRYFLDSAITLGAKFVHPVAPGPLPCSMMIGVPVPASKIWTFHSFV